MITFADDEEALLTRFYTLLKRNLMRTKSIRSSVLMALLETRSASRYKILSSSTIDSSTLSNEMATRLLSKKYIQTLGSIDKYVISAWGIWQYEREHDLITEEMLFSYINQRVFNDEYSQNSTKNKLDDKNKVILLAMIAARAFSDKSTVDLRKSELIKEKWREIMESSFNLLKEMHLIAKEKDEIFHKSPNEHITTYMFRHNDRCLQKTHGIYRYKGNYEYYLNIYRENVFSDADLSYLLWKIFEGKHLDSIDSIIKFFKDTSKNSIYLFDMKNHIFYAPEYDSLVEKCLLDSVISKNKWSKIN